jgi:type IV pilus assembly protein PilZ
MGEDESPRGGVIWVTPKGAQAIKASAGIGVQFSEQDRGQTQKKIETILPVRCPGTRRRTM